MKGFLFIPFPPLSDSNLSSCCHACCYKNYAPKNLTAVASLNCLVSIFSRSGRRLACACSGFIRPCSGIFRSCARLIRSLRLGSIFLKSTASCPVTAVNTFPISGILFLLNWSGNLIQLLHLPRSASYTPYSFTCIPFWSFISIHTSNPHPSELYILIIILS